MMRFLLVLALMLVFTACGEEASDTAAPEPATASEAPAATEGMARLENGVQLVEIEAGPMGYAPGTVTLKAGIPARLVFTRTVESECSEQVKIPAFGIPVTDLPLNEPVTIEFTPDESGEFAFVCGMEMQHGALLVRT